MKLNELFAKKVERVAEEVTNVEMRVLVVSSRSYLRKVIEKVGRLLVWWVPRVWHGAVHEINGRRRVGRARKYARLIAV